MGDLKAVEEGLVIKGLSKRQQKAKFRNPDNLSNASEELTKLTKHKYQKVAGSRDIGPHLNIDGINRSHSFNVLLDGIKQFFETRC